MSQDNPFAKLGALDKMLYQDTTPTPRINEVEKYVDKQPKENPAETHLLTFGASLSH